MAGPESKIEPDSSPLSSSPGSGNDDLEQRLERAFLERDKLDDEALIELLTGDDEIDERVLELIATDRIAEEGLDAIEREGLAEAVQGDMGGRLVGDYRLLHEIGSGGMGVLYLAEDTRLGRLCALKLLPRATESTVARFQREAEITAKLVHPNIVPVYGVGESEGVRYIAMRYIAGRDIERTLSRTKRAGSSPDQALYDRAVRWMSLVADALQHAHDHGVLHRDVKPSNILIENDQPFILDFGLATHDDEISITRPGDLVGTVAYMPPEQVRGEVDDLDRRADVYAMGATLYQLLAGSVPFAGRNAQVIARQILTRDPAPLTRYGIPRDLEAVVFRAMEKDATRRYASARELGEDLVRYLQRVPVRARHLGPLRRFGRIAWRHRFAVAAAVLVVGGLVTAAVQTSWGRRRQEDVSVARMTQAYRSAERERYRDAVVVLGRLLDDHPGFSDAAKARDLREIYRLHELNDRGMQQLFAAAVFDADSVEDIFAEADAVGRPEVLSDQRRFLRVVLLQKMGRRDAARASLDEWERDEGRTRPTAVVRLYLDAVGRDASPNRYAEVEARLKEVPSAVDADDHFFVALIFALTKGGEKRGLREIDRLLEDRPNDFWARFIRGNLLRRLGRSGEAREVYSALIARIAGGTNYSPPKLKAAYYQRGFNSYLLGDFERAIVDLRRGRSDIGPWESSRTIALCQVKLGRIEDALATYDEALRLIDREVLDPERELAEARRLRDRREILGAILDCCRKTGDFARADELVATIAGDDESAARLMRVENAVLRAERADKAEARGLFRRAVAEIDAILDDVDAPQIEILRAKALYGLGDAEDAIATLDDLLDVRPHLADARFMRAWFSFQVAFAHENRYFDAIVTDPDDAEFVEHRVRVRRALSDIDAVRWVGIERLTDVDADVVDFAEGALRYWNREPWRAADLLGDVASRPVPPGRGWQVWVDCLHGRALEACAKPRAALVAYRRGLDRLPSHNQTLALAARVAARLDDPAAFGDVIAIMKRSARPGWSIARELVRSVYDDVRDDPRFAPFFATTERR